MKTILLILSMIFIQSCSNQYLSNLGLPTLNKTEETFENYEETPTSQLNKTKEIRKR